MIKKIIYISRTRLDHSLNSARIKELNKNGVEVIGFYVKSGGIRGLVKTASFCLHNSNNIDAVMVGFGSPVLVIFSRLFYHKRIVYNAVLTVYERMIISRGLTPKFSVKAIYYWFTDFMAVHFADLIMVESNQQADYFKKMFKVSGKKLYRNWIGVEEDRFFYDPLIKKLPVFTVLFRGLFVPESGVEYAIKAAKILEKKEVNFVIVGSGHCMPVVQKLISELKPSNLKIITDTLPQDHLNELMQSSHLSLGQLSNHERLSRTIPHKAYESLAIKLPYLTAFNTGILELLTPDETCLTCNPADAKSLAEKILWAKNNYPLVDKIAQNGYQLYQNKLRSHILVKNLLDRIGEL